MGLIDRFGLGLGHLNYLAVSGVGIVQFLFVPVTINYFMGWGISIIFDLTFLPRGREFYSNFLENVKMSYAPPLPPPNPPCRFDIDSCISLKQVSCYELKEF